MRHAQAHRFQTQLAVLAFQRGFQDGQVTQGFADRSLPVGIESDHAIALDDAERRVIENTGRQVGQVDLRATQTAQHRAHLLQQSGIRTRFDRDGTHLHQAHDAVA